MKMNLKEELSADLERIGGHGFLFGVRQYFFPRGECFPYVFWFRVSGAVRKMRVLKIFLAPIVYVVLRHYEFKYQAHGNANIEVGPGLRIAHGQCHLNAEKIGCRLTVYQNVTIGIKDGLRPEIGDDVTIFPGAVVVGGIKVGNHVTIGALSYVAHDVPDGVTVAGVPAKVI